MACSQDSATDAIPEAQSVNSVTTIIADMTLPHEGLPHGVPTHYDWQQHPRLGMGATPGTFTAAIAWGQLYEDAATNPATNTRVQIRNIRMYYLSTSRGTWHLLQHTEHVEGALYREDFVDNVNVTPDVREAPDGGGITVTAGDGYNYHFWPASGRVPIDPEDIGGVFTTVQARLIVANETQPDDRAQARYLLSMGGDYWLNLNAVWDQWRTNGDIGIGRFKYVTPDWQAFNMITLAPDAVRANPPPLH